MVTGDGLIFLSAIIEFRCTDGSVALIEWFVLITLDRLADGEIRWAFDVYLYRL